MKNKTELQLKINQATKFGVVAGIIESETYFEEFKENASIYHADWFLEIDNKDKSFSTISNFDIEERNAYHIIMTINDDVDAIKNKIIKIKQSFENEEIGTNEYLEELENVLNHMKIKDAYIEEI